jgi:hypothetical protein
MISSRANHVGRKGSAASMHSGTQGKPEGEAYGASILREPPSDP